MTDTGNPTRQPNPSDVAAAQLLLRLMAERGEVPPNWALDLANNPRLHRAMRPADARTIVELMQREGQTPPTWALELAVKPEPQPLAPRRTSRLAVAALAIGIVFSVLYTFILGASLLGANLNTSRGFDITGLLTIFGFISIFFFPFFLLAIILGHVAARLERRNIGHGSNTSGVALILGYIFGSISLLSIAYEVVGVVILIVGLTTQQGVS